LPDVEAWKPDNQTGYFHAIFIQIKTTRQNVQDMTFDYSKQRNKTIFTTGCKKEWINVGDILFITIDLTLSSVFVQHRENPYYFAKQLKEFKTELADYGFFRVNKNTLVNGKHVKSLEKENNKHVLRLQGGKTIHLSRRQYSIIRKMINQQS